MEPLDTPVVVDSHDTWSVLMASGRCHEREHPGYLLSPRGKWYELKNDDGMYWVSFARGTCTTDVANGRRYVVRYALTSGNDCPGRDPCDWRLQGQAKVAHGDLAWVDVDQRTGVVFQQRHQRLVFRVERPGPFFCYRLAISRTKAEGGGVQLSRVELLEE